MGGDDDNIVTVRWTPAHVGAEGNEMADLYAKGAAESTAHAVDQAYLRETSLAHMTRVATESRTEGTVRWIASHIQRRRGTNHREGGSSEGNPNTSARPLRADITSSNRDTRPPRRASAAKCESSRLTGAGGADKSGRPATTSSSSARRRPLRSGPCG